MKCVCVLLLFVGLVLCDSNLIDLPNLPEFTIDVKQIEDMVKDQCKLYGGDNAYQSLKDSVIELKNYFEKNFKFDVISNEVESAKKTSSLDEVFKKYCDLKPEVMKRAHKVGGAIENCLAKDEKAVFQTVENITEGLIDFVCDKDGEHLALFIVEDGFTCIASKADELQKCGNDTVGSKIPTTFDKIPSLIVTKEECGEYKKIQECILQVLEGCTNSIPSNVVDSLLTYMYKLSPCNTLK